MREIRRILTDRKFEREVSFHLVYEWEDVLSKELEIPLVNNIWHRGNRYIKRIPGLSKLVTRGKLSLLFQMNAKVGIFYCYGNSRDIIPVIIDFFLPEDQLARFEKNFSKNPLVLISSKEVYDYLKKCGTKLPIAHWALSLSDKYKITQETHYDKMYDLVIMGRQNSVLLNFLKKYVSKNPSFSYVYCKDIKREDGHRDFFYYTSTGKSLGTKNNRQEYIDLMRQARCSLYSTPNIDTDGTRAHGFNQVTPKFLEYISSGCHILARYPKNSDTDYFELDKFSPSIETYEQFEERMDYCRTHDVDMKFYSDYLEKHYTSTRAKELQDILKQY